MKAIRFCRMSPGSTTRSSCDPWANFTARAACGLALRLPRIRWRSGSSQRLGHGPFPRRRLRSGQQHSPMKHGRQCSGRALAEAAKQLEAVLAEAGLPGAWRNRAVQARGASLKQNALRTSRPERHTHPAFQGPRRFALRPARRAGGTGAPARGIAGNGIADRHFVMTKPDKLCSLEGEGKFR